MKTVWKRRGVAAAVLLLVCGAVYMNWRYSDSVKDNKVLGQSELFNANEETAGDPAPAEDDYFATARLSRKQARDNAIHMLQEAESDENAEESVLNEASRTLQVLASYTVAESQIEQPSSRAFKGFADALMSQTHTQNWDFSSELFDHRNTDACLLRSSRARGKNNCFWFQLFYFCQ